MGDISQIAEGCIEVGTLEVSPASPQREDMCGGTLSMC